MSHTSNRNAILVLGMHRSGTSAATRVLNMLGYELPKSLMGVNENNQAGHWESDSIVVLNDMILDELGVRWDSWKYLTTDEFTSVRKKEIVEEIERHLRLEFPGKNDFILKDPRISRLADLYLEALDKNKVKPYVLIPIRNPLEVADSLHKRDNMSKGDAALLWLRHVLDAEFASRGQRRAFFTYAQIMDNSVKTLKKISHDLEIKFPRNIEPLVQQFDTFLREDLRHNKRSLEDVVFDPIMRGWVDQTYTLVLTLCVTPKDKKVLDELDEIRRELDHVAPIMENLQKANEVKRKEQEVQLKELNNQVTIKEQELRVKLTQLAEESQGKYAHLKQDAAAQIAMKDQEFEVRIAQLEEEFQAKYAHLKQDAVTQMATKDQDFEARIAQLEEEFQAKYEHLKQDAAAQMAEKELDVSARITQVQQDAQAKLIHSRQDVAAQITKMEKDVTARIIQMEQDTATALKEKDRLLSEQKEKYAALSSELKDAQKSSGILNSEVKDLQDKLEQQAGEASQLMKTLELKGQEYAEKLKVESKLEARLADIEKEYSGLLKVVEQKDLEIAEKVEAEEHFSAELEKFALEKETSVKELSKLNLERKELLTVNFDLISDIQTLKAELAHEKRTFFRPIIRRARSVAGHSLRLFLPARLVDRVAHKVPPKEQPLHLSSSTKLPIAPGSGESD